MRRTEALTCLLILVAVLSTSSFAAESFPISVIDDRGETIVIDVLPARIVAVGALYAEIVVDLGALDRLVAVADSPDNPAVTSDLPSVGSTYAPNVEWILSQEPDLVLGATDWGGERPALEAAGIPVLTTPLLTGVIDIFDSIHTVGTAIGKAAESAVLIGRQADDPPYAAGTGAIEHELILRAGGVNVFADVIEFPPVSFEALLARDPAVIFTAPSQIVNFTENPLLQGVAAVRDGRVVGIRGSDVTSTRVVDALRAIIQALHGIEI